MIYHHIYNSLLEKISNNFSKTWPEEAFSCAPWNDIAANIETIFNARSQDNKQFPHHVRLGYMDDNAQTGSIFKLNNSPKNIQIPLLFDWSSYRGIVLHSDDIDKDGDTAPMDIVRKIGSSMLLRIVLQAEQNNILIHKVDPKGLGKDMTLIPHQTMAPIIVDKEGITQLLNKCRHQIANEPVDAVTWRCDMGENSYAADSHPIHIIYIADWNDLYDNNGEQSDVQKQILSMLQTDLSARNGFYFFICCSAKQSKNFTATLPMLAIDNMKQGTRGTNDGYFARWSTKIAKDKTANANTIAIKENFTHSCRFELPTDEELMTVQKALTKYQSGTLTDADGEGIWLGNSSKGLRAIMGTTAQGENQFFELGIGQAYDAFHALIGGATGSGKSVLLSEIICSLAERYSPQELRMLLLDYKEGTEFAPFAKLPHVYALSVGANAEFGLEVLKEVQNEIGRRGALFKEVNAKNLNEYRRLTGSTMCRYVLVADEFQVLLGDKKFGAEAKTVLNDLVRRGRSFGFHAILATQTLRDGSLDGEAKNQFGCRIAMRMAESETDYFLASGNTVPSTFNRKGQALLNYALGRKESNILFQSGNQKMPKKFRDTPEVLECVNSLHKKAVAEKCLPTDVYIYSSDGFAEPPAASIDTSAGVLVGLRNNMQSTPVYISQRQLSAKVLILGGTEKKRNTLLNVLSSQLGSLYNENVSVQTPAEYLDYPASAQVTILNVPEGDFDFEAAIAAWQEAGEQAAQSAMSPQGGMGMPQPDMSAFCAPEGMEDDFAELMQSMQANNAKMNYAPAASAPAPRRGRNRDTRCLIIALGTSADIKLMEHAGMYTNDFRTVIYLDHVIYNQVSGEYENTALGEAAAILESPRGVVTKMRLIR